LKGAADIARQIDSPYAHAMVEMVRGFASVMFGEWKSGQASLDHADQLFREQCTGVTWERDTLHDFVLWALFQRGELAELQRRWSGLYRESQERGDLYAATMLTTFYKTIIKLARNESLESEAELESAVDRRHDRRFSLQHGAALESLLHLYLYRGDISRGWIRLQAIWPEYSQAMLLRVQLIRIHLLELRARVALSLAERSNAPEAYLRQASSDARWLQREGQKWARAHAHYVRAGIAACEEDAVRAVAELTAGADLYEAADMPLRAHILRYRLGEIVNDPPNRAAREAAEQWIRNQGIVSPARWSGMFAPGFAKISGDSMETTY
jgi:hypothetical protein